VTFLRHILQKLIMTKGVNIYSLQHISWYLRHVAKLVFTWLG
jgi:hypothetical protein